MQNQRAGAVGKASDAVSPDPLDLYNLERYLLGTVSQRFHAQGYLNAFDFFCIIIWKANRAKSQVARGLLRRSGLSLESTVHHLTAALASAPTDRDRFEILVETWGLRLPMVSAILTMLYPNQFTVYDVRACEMLDGFHSIASRQRLDSLWTGYQEFQEAVRRRTPEGLSLRDKDRWLWSHSFADQLRGDLAREFRAEKPDSPQQES